MEKRLWQLQSNMSREKEERRWVQFPFGKKESNEELSPHLQLPTWELLKSLEFTMIFSLLSPIFHPNGKLASLWLEFSTLTWYLICFAHLFPLLLFPLSDWIWHLSFQAGDRVVSPAPFFISEVSAECAAVTLPLILFYICGLLERHLLHYGKQGLEPSMV